MSQTSARMLTIKKLKLKKKKVYVSKLWNDVDTHEDLIDLYRKNIGTKFKSSKTMAFLDKNIKKIQEK